MKYLVLLLRKPFKNFAESQRYFKFQRGHSLSFIKFLQCGNLDCLGNQIVSAIETI